MKAKATYSIAGLQRSFLRTGAAALFLFLAGSEINAQQLPAVPANGAKRYRITAYKLSNASTSSLSNIAEANPNPTMYIPSAFTPNGDGINDFFGVKAEGIKQFKLEIFNRWGELVFESDDINTLWDGTYQGEKITSTDVYVYQVKAIGVNDKVLPEEKGRVTLVAEGVTE
jgi:gliding motility-associated-like protein